jgi:hypothetical protein
MFGNYGDLIDGVGLICAKMGTGKDGETIPGKTHRTAKIGTAETGVPFEILCPEGQVVAGFRGRWTMRIVAAGIACAPLSEIVAAAKRAGGGP